MTNWKNNGVEFKDFTEKLTKQWLLHGFNLSETKQWLALGADSNEYAFCAWVKNFLKMNPSEVIDKIDDIQKLKNEFKKWEIDEEKDETENLEENQLPKEKVTRPVLGEYLGEGSFGKVFRGEWNNKTVVVKKSFAPVSFISKE